MTTALALTFAYLAINLGLMIWVERERAHERELAWQVGVAVAALRYAPPIACAIYLVVLSGDWQFVLLVLGFFAISGWLMTGLLAYSNPRPDRRDRWWGDR
jgi:hypothetical protein